MQKAMKLGTTQRAPSGVAHSARNASTTHAGAMRPASAATRVTCPQRKLLQESSNTQLAATMGFDSIPQDALLLGGAAIVGRLMHGCGKLSRETHG